MKRIKLFVASLAALALAAIPLWPLFAEDNLLANPSVETITNNQPANWHADRWGSNQANLTVNNEGHDGSKSLHVNMTQHTDGDAKWMADPVAVTPGTEYTYTSYYKSNIATEIDLQYTHADGSTTYEYVQSVPASVNWQQLRADFIVPQTVSKVVVLHVVAQVGWLQTDEFKLATKVATTPADEENLIANPSFATANGDTPASWNKNVWGSTSAQFSYESQGRTDNRSAKVTVSQHIDGDAKWYANPVDVQAGKTYLYRDYYKANVASRLVVAYIDASGNYSYAELDSAPASTDWRQYQTTFVVPANAAKVTIFHLIDRVGSLHIDDTLLQVAVTGGPTPVIPNASLESAASSTMPSAWQHSSWGSNSAQFAYVNEGHTGSKSVKVTLSNYQNGDGKWYFEPINTLQPDTQYRFSVWYKTNVLPQAVMMYLTADGSEHYLGMPAPQPGANGATTWQQYSDTFTVPSDAVRVSVFLYANQNGWLQTDDYSITEYHPSGFNRPLLSLTFDDGHEDNTSTVLPIMQQYGYKSTQCYATTFIEGNPEAVSNVRAFQNAGHEICSHTVTHPFLTSLNATQLNYELQHSRQYLESITGVPVDNFASPYGDYNATVNQAITSHYGSHRTVDEGFNSKDNFDRYRLRVQNILDTTSADQVRQWIQQAQADNTWLILVYHRVADDPGPYDSYSDVFAEHLETISQSGITVQTYRDALAEVTSQL